MTLPPSQPPPDLCRELEAIVAKAKRDEPLSRHSTFGIGGPADFFAEVKTTDQMKNLMLWTKKRGIPLFPIGQGSNLIIGDKGIRGVVVRLRGDLEEASFDGESAIVGAGAPWPSFAKKCAAEGLSGAEPLVGVPGTVGGGLMSNAGTPEGDTGSLIEWVEVLTEEGAIEKILKKDMVFRYRFSSLQGRFILRAGLKLRRENKNDIMQKIEQQLARRLKNQPLGTFNVGSIFKNPPGSFAAQWVEKAGLKGFKIGGAQVSTRHANFIVNVEKATARDVRSLIEKIQETVREKFGVELEREAMFVGEF